MFRLWRPLTLIIVILLTGDTTFALVNKLKDVLYN
jgi:hypothetical protein